MLTLTRTVRFSVNPPTDATGAAGPHQPLPAPSPASNTFAAFPSMRGLGRHYELDVTCRGEVSPTTGYFINIKDIDRAVRATAIPLIARACRVAPHADPAAVLRETLPALNDALDGAVASVRWRLSPYYSVEMAITRNDEPATALMRQQFEFAASHRLHVPSLSDEENRRLFGKCNHPLGHGHNYRVEPCVEVRLPAPGAAPAPGETFSLEDLERITMDRVVSRFDHKHLNDDTAEFDTKARVGGLNPSVENIARVCYDLLAPAIAAAAPHVRLRSVTVWETDKTSCTYPAMLPTSF